mmetsp:Transcript_67600/g.161741  ORF Transcript_67600/g.161741 Transcript_67600/m.161741 type:complete len:247 (+) Transcript_67600:240-980(+)
MAPQRPEAREQGQGRLLRDPEKRQSAQAEPRVACRLDSPVGAFPHALDAGSTPSSTASNASFVDEASALFSALVADPFLALSRPASAPARPAASSGRSSPPAAFLPHAASHPGPAPRAPSHSAPHGDARRPPLAPSDNLHVTVKRHDDFSRRPPIPPRTASSRDSQAQVRFPSFHARGLETSTFDIVQGRSPGILKLTTSDLTWIRRRFPSSPLAWLGPSGSVNSHYRRTLELILQKGPPVEHLTP